MRTRSRSHGAKDRKQRQLCGQVHRVVDMTLGESGDPLLQGCYVVDVRPSPDQARLRVRVQSSEPVSIPELEAALHRAAGWVRAEVASAITRRRAPQLALVWAGPDDR